MTSPHQPEGPQSPAPGPQSPGPQSPAPGPQSPQYAPPPGAPPQQYGGSVPPGGWHQPPQPALTGELASWGSRVGAYVIDFLIIVIPSLIILALLGGGVVATGDDGDGGFFAFVAALLLTLAVIVVVALLYAPLLMMRQGAHNGQTIGKQLVGVRAVRDNGQAWTFGSAALREVVMKNLAVGVASSVIPILPWFLNFLWPLWDDQNRALHDMAVSSHVVRA